MLSIELAGGYDAAKSPWSGACSWWRNAVSLSEGVQGSLAVHAASGLGRLSIALIEAAGLSTALVRIAVGLEHPEDLGVISNRPWLF